MPLWLIALLAYLALALPSALLFLAALVVGAAPERARASPGIQGLPGSLEPTPVDQV